MSQLNAIPLKDWGLDLGEGPLIISGPCSAESPGQVMETILGLSDLPIQVMRAGIWKPRTRPNSFEGVGSVGLKWLKDAGQAIHKPVTTEVANVKHVYEALRSGVDIIWIGARTTTNPFAVQEIADALEGVDIPVFVKNPVNPDLELWIGAMERIAGAGITRIGAIHRGFSSYAKTKYRNQPLWEIPIELRRRIPDLPIICDPSHICGRRDLLLSVAQEAMDLNFDGLMIESHITPDKALSDARQQITPAQMGELIGKLVLRKATIEGDNELREQLQVFREMIDGIDQELLQTLGKRMEVVRKIGEAKKAHNMTILQAQRWNNLMHDRSELAKSLGLGEEFVLDLLQQVHKESIRQQTEIMNRELSADAS
ncbi:MAG: bifunctional 3-deoxy-7-phosphoheptulonate synthase/chorismate mutase type II [Bacteroidota bacterium]